MKRLVFFLVAILLVGVMLLPACRAAPAPTPAPETIIWKYSGIAAANNVGVILLMEMADVVLERTGGRFTWEYHQFAELGYKGPEMLQIYGSGESKMGELSGGYLTGEEPVLGVGLLPFLNTAEQVPTKLDALQPYADKVLDKHNIKALMHYEWPNLLWSTIEVNTLDDIKKIKLRAHPPVIDAISRLGGSGVTLPSAEVYQAFATGILNSAAYAITSGIGYGFPEVTNFLYLSPVLDGTPAWMVVNKDAFNSLPTDVQKVLIDTAKEYEPEMIDTFRYPTPEAMAELRAKMTVYPSLDPQLVEQIIKQGALPVWDKWTTEYPEVKPALDAMTSALGISL